MASPQSRVLDLITTGPVGFVDQYISSKKRPSLTSTAAGASDTSADVSASVLVEGSSALQRAGEEAGEGPSDNGGVGDARKEDSNAPLEDARELQRAGKGEADGVGVGKDHAGAEWRGNKVKELAEEAVLDGISLEKLAECEEDLASLEHVNRSQQIAVSAALTRRLTVIQGPPGTGKTTASVQILRLWSKLGVKNILATADGNVAVDNIAMGLAKAGVNVVRVGRPEKISSLIEDITLDTLVGKRKQQMKDEKAQDAAEAKIKARDAHSAAVSRRLEDLREELMAVSLEEVLAEERKMRETQQQQSAPCKLEFCNCAACPELNGSYLLVDSEENPDSEQQRPVYRKQEDLSKVSAGDDAAGTGEVDDASEAANVWCFYGTIKGRAGWYMAKKKDSLLKKPLKSKGVVAFSPMKDNVPPKGGWQIKEEGEMVADAGGFVVDDDSKEQVVARILAAREKKLWADYDKAEGERCAMEESRGPDWRPVGKGGGGAKLTAADLQKAQRREDYDIGLTILREADVVCAQMISAGGDFLKGLGPFGAILIDEVAQCTEIGAIVPIVQRGCSRLVLAGDHCQLPPSVQSQEAESRGLSLSLYGRLVRWVQPFFLDTQFRAHPKLMEFCAKAIYDGRLKSGIAASERAPVAGFEWPRKSVPVAFVETVGAEEKDGESKQNQAEAARVLELLKHVLDAYGLQVAQVGVITPYVAQCRLLRRVWSDCCRAQASKDKSTAKPKGGKRSNVDGGAAVAGRWHLQARDLEIASVDNFQGREKELIIFSAVRCNRFGNVGFLGDWRRLNVMLTRARRGSVLSLVCLSLFCWPIRPPACLPVSLSSNVDDQGSH